ncbi:hypothetical protein [Arthrobacter mobilis]|nr:hypothetical protein [Arthrobacter mobilis]
MVIDRAGDETGWAAGCSTVVPPAEAVTLELGGNLLVMMVP